MGTMTPEETKAAKELIKRGAFVWMPGMRVLSDPFNRVPGRVDDSGYVLRSEFVDGILWKTDYSMPTQPDHPDLSDPATCGCLLAQLVEKIKARGKPLSPLEFEGIRDYVGLELLDEHYDSYCLREHYDGDNDPSFLVSSSPSLGLVLARALLAYQEAAQCTP